MVRQNCVLEILRFIKVRNKIEAKFFANFLTLLAYEPQYRNLVNTSFLGKFNKHFREISVEQ